jgi:hypothetical protein
MDLLPIEESACYRRLRDPRIVDSESFRFPKPWVADSIPAEARWPGLRREEEPGSSVGRMARHERRIR